MDPEFIQRQKEEVIRKFGEWSAHNIQLKGDIYTIDKKIIGNEISLGRVIQVVSDIAGKPLGDLRILDLACLEGLYALEFARHGSTVVAIEGRIANIEKARFAKNILGLTTVDFFQDDVRNLSVDKYGHFDVVLCLGILYHLGVPDAFSFLEQIFRVCTGLAIIDTHVSLYPKKSCFYKGKEYWGKEYLEHRADSSLEEREKSVWASMDNLKSFWFTRPSLLNLLSHVGFSSVHECRIPEEPRKPIDRVTLVAIKGNREQLICCPLMSGQPSAEIPEKSEHYYAGRLIGLWHKPSLLVPRQLRGIMKKMIASLRRQK